MRVLWMMVCLKFIWTSLLKNARDEAVSRESPNSRCRKGAGAGRGSRTPKTRRSADFEYAARIAV
jgi:hypothetical protein